jgi:hypothetical protein
MSLLFSLYMMYISVYYYIKSLFQPDYTTHKKWINYVFTYGKNKLNWNYRLTDNNKTLIKCNSPTFKCTNTDVSINENIPDKLLLLSNHVNFMDAFIIPYIVAKYFSRYTAIYITKEEYGKIPIIGTYLRRNHILIKGSGEQDIDIIKSRINELSKKHEKLLVILFPEGCLRYPASIKKSDNWCDKQNIDKYNNVLAPRINGLYNILMGYKPECIIQTILNYPVSDIKSYKGVWYSDILYGNLPNFVNLTLNDNTDIINNMNYDDKNEFTNEFYKYWKINVDNNII